MCKCQYYKHAVTSKSLIINSMFSVNFNNCWVSSTNIIYIIIRAIIINDKSMIIIMVIEDNY